LRRRQSFDAEDEVEDKNQNIIDKLNISLTRKGNPVKFGIMSPAMMGGFVSPLDSITKIRSHNAVEIE